MKKTASTVTKSSTRRPAAKSSASAAAAMLTRRVDFEAFIAKLGAKDRQNIEKHIAALEAEPDGKHLKLWKRMVTTLATLAPHIAQTNGQQSIQFFIADGADGRYRKQVFALEDLRDGKQSIYTIDVLDQVTANGLLEAPPRDRQEEPGTPGLYGILQGGPASTRPSLSIEPLDSNNTPDPPAFYKHMLGWNRKALRVVLPNDAVPAQLAAAEEVFAVAAKSWQPAAK